MRLMTKTHGVMPTREEFEWLWETLDANEQLRDGVFHFGNDKRVGTCSLTQKAYHEVCIQYSEPEDLSTAESTDDWLSCVLGCLGLEWV